MNAVISWFARSPVAANVLMLIIVCLGLISLPSMQRDTLPRIDGETVEVQVAYPGASAEEVEASLVRVIEERLVGLENLKDLSSVAREGMAAVRAELIEGSDADAALAEVRNRVSAITTFPQDAEEPVVRLAERLDLVAFLMLTGDVDAASLRSWAYRVQERLIDQEIGSQVLIDGLRQREFHIHVDALALRQHGLSLAMVEDAVRDALVSQPAGTMSTAESDFLIRVTTPREDLDFYRSIPLVSNEHGSVLRLDAVAEIGDGYEHRPLIIRYNGQPALQLTISKDRHQDVLRANARLDTFLVQANGHPKLLDQPGWLPPSLHLERTFAWADLVESRLRLLVDNGLLGLVLVFCALWAFTSWRVAMWVCAGLAIALLGTLWLLHVQGATINMISMFALIMAVGILVDDAIIVSENIYARLEQGSDPRAAVVRGTQQVLVPIIGATATSAAAFLPLAMVPGAVGDFMVVLPITIIAGLIFSLIECFFILPHHLLPAMRRKHVDQRRLARSAARPSPGRRKTLGARLGHLRQSIDGALAWYIARVVLPTARLTVRWRYAVLALSCAVLLACLGMIRGGIVPWRFFVNPDGDVITVSVRFEQGTPIAVTSKQVQLLEAQLEKSVAALLATPTYAQEAQPIVHRSTMIGSLPSSRGTMRADGSHVAGLIIGLRPNEQRNLAASTIMQRWQDDMQDQRLAGLQSMRFEGIEAGPSGADIDIRFAAPSWPALEQITHELRQALQSYDGVHNIDDNLRLGTPELQARVNDFGRSLGLRDGDVARSLRRAVIGGEALRLQIGADEVVIRVGSPSREIVSHAHIARLPITTPVGIMELGQVATITRQQPIASIHRSNRQRVVTVTADLRSGVNTDDILDALGRDSTNLRADSELARMRDQHGAQFLFEGVAATQSITMQGLQRGMLVAVVVIYLILVLTFASWLQPIAILAIIPIGFIGAVAGHLVLGLTMSVISFFGIVGLTGIVVNDAITCIHFINHHRRNGQSLGEAVVTAVGERFRPIIMTTVTTVAGLLPLLLETSTQAAFLIPMAAAISFGLIASTVGTLIVIPALLVVLYDIRGGMLWLRHGISPLHHVQARQQNDDATEELAR
ncbi:MAG: efflux RND transporter permease subunit [Planctomycetota bacterium]|nr:MAG: efflux RND transporter permease subunit [Planctomycetota bacterium]